MDTPIREFVQRYVHTDPLRLHMPGHKGTPLLGIETLDITEITGADSLYEAEGIIRQSERNCGRLFGCQSFYSTEGSSLCIRAMLYLCVLYANSKGTKPLIVAGRNAHKAFLSGVSLLDIDVQWLYPENNENYLSCKITASELENTLLSSTPLPTAVYLTSPDYLGNMVDLVQLSKVCHKFGVLLLVDNAHGAYLKFLPASAHPMDLGADICCDSAHKTLPVLTGGAYLHISSNAPGLFVANAKRALGMFGSTSPSYLILQSLDTVNRYLAGDYTCRLSAFIAELNKTKSRLEANGYTFTGTEPLKFTIDARKYGYKGSELAEVLREKQIECEFADPDYLVLMLTPETGLDGLKRLEDALLAVPERKRLSDSSPVLAIKQRVMSPREACFSPCETIPISDCEGRILASSSVGCPPAVPIVICGERIDRAAIECFSYYGIETCCVVVESDHK